MDIAELFSYLTEFGSLAMFAAFLFHQYKQQTARLDKLVDDFQVSLKEIEQTHKNDEKALRARYDEVIEVYRKEIAELKGEHASDRTEIRSNLAVKLEEIHRTVFAVMKKTDVNAAEIGKGLEIMSQWQLEQKARELAKSKDS